MTTEIITLKDLCKELKLDPREARGRLRAAVRDTKNFPELTMVHKPSSLWKWVKGSASEKEVRLLFSKYPMGIRFNQTKNIKIQFILPNNRSRLALASP